MEERMIDAGEVRLHTVIEGKGPPVILLHGFPEFWYSWRHQIAALSGAGFTAIAPDLRGYNLSDKPKAVGAYRFAKLAGDVIGLMKALGHERVRLAGHDWGGAIAWYLAMNHSERIEKLAILNCPHPRLFARGLRSREQLKRSWYMFLFQLPLLPERLLLAEGFERRVLRHTAARKEAFTDEDLARFREAHRQPGAARAALNYYRAMLRRFDSRAISKRPIRVPTLVIWGRKDRALGESLLDGLPRLVPDLRIHRIPGAGHWVGQEAPEEVNRELVAFFR